MTLSNDARLAILGVPTDANKKPSRSATVALFESIDTTLIALGAAAAARGAVNTKSAAYTAQPSDDKNVMVKTGSGFYEIAFPAPSAGGFPLGYHNTLINPTKRAWRVKMTSDAAVTRYIFVWPGDTMNIWNLGLGDWFNEFGTIGPRFDGNAASTSGVAKLYVKPSSGSDGLNDGLGTDAPLATVGRSENIWCYLANMNGTQAISEIMAGEIVRENHVHQFTAPPGVNQFYIQAASGGAVWAHNGSAGIQTRDGAICTVRRAPGGTGVLRFVSVDIANNPVNGGVALYASQMSVIDTEDGLEFGGYPLGQYMLCEDAYMNIKNSLTISGGASSGFIARVGGRIGIQGGITFNITVNTNYDAVYGGFLDVSSQGRIVCGGGITISSLTNSGRKYWNRSLGYLSLGGNTFPGAVAGATVSPAVTE